MSLTGDQTDGAMSRRRLLFLGTASALGVVFGRLLDPVMGRGRTTAAPPPVDPHAGHGGPPTHGGPEPSESADAVVQGTTLVRWSDPATWKGKLPGPNDVVKIDAPVLLDVNASVGGVVIDPKGSLIFDPVAARTLTSKGNVIVRGKLSMRPAKPTVVHRLFISGATESAFKGGGAIPLASDTGLWVVSNGVLDAIGSTKRGWIRAAGSVAKGAKSVALAATPTGWRVGDEVVITPTRSPASTNKQHLEYETATITSISGRTVGLSRAAAYAHPRVDVASGKSFTAEVLNLTRNVRIEGKPGARTHVFLNSGKKQVIKYVGIRHVGPRKATKGGVLGRYGLHFHMVGNASRGSLVEGTVVRDAGHHAFVPHASNGITFRDCVSHSTMSAAYWWDPGEGNATQDVLYDRCVASRVIGDGRDFRLTGFWLGHGKGNAARGCVGVGIDADKNSSGFQWPESPGGRGDGTVWGFTDCVAHNNSHNGIFVWQNTGEPSVIDRFVAYHNGKAGIEHGAYKNGYTYKNSILYGNRFAGAMVWAVSRQGLRLTFADVVFDGAGMSDYAMFLEHHNAPPGQPTRVEGCTFRGYKEAAFGLVQKNAENADTIDIVGCSFSSNEFWLGSTIDPASILRVQDPKLGTLALRRADQPGVFRPEWNASVTPISKFA